MITNFTFTKTCNWPSNDNFILDSTTLSIWYQNSRMESETCICKCIKIW